MISTQLVTWTKNFAKLFTPFEYILVSELKRQKLNVFLFGLYKIIRQKAKVMISLTQLPAHGAVLILVASSLCDAALLSTLANFTKGKTVLTSYRTIQPYSKARCVEKCVEEGLAGWCSVAGYVTATRTCHLSLDSDQDVVDVNDAMLGVFFMTNGRCSLCSIRSLCIFTF